MSSVNTAPIQQSSKGSSSSNQASLSQQFQSGGSTSATDSGSQRRAGGSGSFGAGQISRNSASPRNTQSLRRQHKGGKKARLADEDAYAESAAMKSTTSRKGQTSITHLMNISLPPRPQYHPSHYGHRTPRRPHWGLGSGYHAVDKARYVHANYRFIVNPQGDYHAQAVDADVHLDWANVLQVLASAQTQSASCPICLSTPTAPRMAKCGHIFCLPCLIRYMHSTDDANPVPEKKARSKSCPICEDSIFMSETRSVRWFVGQEVDMAMAGGDILFRLVSRQPGSTLALPRDGAEGLRSNEDIPWYHAAEVADYARVMKGGEDYMLEQYDQEILELKKQGQEDELMFGEDMTWTKKAISAINEAKEKVAGIGNPPTSLNHPSERKPARNPLRSESSQGTGNITQKAIHSRNESSMTTPYNVSSADVELVDRLAASVSDLHIKPSTEGAVQPEETTIESPRTTSNPQGLGTQRPPDQPFYFYQALPHFYLSPLDIRILKSAFGDFSMFPSTILPRIEHISTGHIVDDELRKRAKYLGHLPYGCEVSFLECDWTDLIGPEVLGRFGTELERRRKKNKEKEMREEKDRIRAEKLEDEQRWAAARRKRPSIVEKGFSDNDFLPLGSEGNIAADTSLASTSPPWLSNRSKSQSFATLASLSTSPSGPRTVWGTAVVPGTSPVIAPEQQNGVPDDGWLQGWEDDLLDRDVIAQVAAAESVGGEGPSSSKTPNGSTRKKNKKKITLMTTNARRGA